MNLEHLLNHNSSFTKSQEGIIFSGGISAKGDDFH